IGHPELTPYADVTVITNSSASACRTLPFGQGRTVGRTWHRNPGMPANASKRMKERAPKCWSQAGIAELDVLDAIAKPISGAAQGEVRKPEVETRRQGSSVLASAT
ncbi:hypothetical protein VaNZ11_016094, partial [Volvox africanus]